MPKIMVRNVEPLDKEAGAEADVTVKQTGGGPPRTETLSSGEETLFEVEQGAKLQVSVGGE